ncbi:MAG: hypothetical protein M1822_006669 [Bathelium mastoideum]|nr:MAG: hypothetical protein M1822_006669 [Bathelium mastoideum]
MFSTSFLTLLLASLSSASPLLSPRTTTTTTTTVSISYDSAPGMSPANWSAPVAIPLANLAVLPGAPVSASSLRIDNTTTTDFDLANVECRAYKDEAGVQPGSAPFTLAQEALLSTNLGSVSSVLCYLTEGDD